MQPKFAVGDRVRIVSSPYEGMESLSVGKEGIILRTIGDVGDPWLYGVAMNVEVDTSVGGWPFYEDELERT